MHKPGFYLILIFLVPACKSSEPPSNVLTKEEVLQFLNVYDKAWNSKDSRMVDSLYGGKYQYFTSVGGVSSRTRNLEILTADYYRLDTAKRTEIEISIEGNIAIVASRWRGSGEWRGELFNDNQRCGLVIQKQESGLKLLAEHCVDIITEPSF